jgi:predicted nucleic acid-binding protein
MPPQFFLDTNVIADWIITRQGLASSQPQRNRSSSVQLVESILSGEYWDDEFLISNLVVAEVWKAVKNERLPIPGAAFTTREAQATLAKVVRGLDQLLESDKVKLVEEAGPRDRLYLQRFVPTLLLTPDMQVMDASLLVTAAKHRANFFVTSDQRLARGVKKHVPRSLGLKAISAADALRRLHHRTDDDIENLLFAGVVYLGHFVEDQRDVVLATASSWGDALSTIDMVGQADEPSVRALKDPIVIRARAYWYGLDEDEGAGPKMLGFKAHEGNAVTHSGQDLKRIKERARKGTRTHNAATTLAMVGICTRCRRKHRLGDACKLESKGGGLRLYCGIVNKDISDVVFVASPPQMSDVMALMRMAGKAPVFVSSVPTGAVLNFRLLPSGRTVGDEGHIYDLEGPDLRDPFVVMEGDGTEFGKLPIMRD